MAKCKGKTKQGKPCTKSAPRGDFCHLHTEAPEVISESIIDRICAVIIESGCHPYIAAMSIGVGKTTFYTWMENADNGDEACILLRERIEESEAVAETHGTKRLMKENIDKWLSRRFRDRWGEVQKIETKQEVSMTGEVKIDKHTQGQLDEIVRKLAAPE